MNRLNCIKCKSTRSVYGNRKTGIYKCRECGAEFYMSTRKKNFYPDSETQKILSMADKYRMEKAYHVDLPIQERENMRDTMKGKVLKFRHGNGHLEERDGKIYFMGRVMIVDGMKKEIDVKTNMSMEEYKLYLMSDPNRDKTIMISPHPPYNLCVSFMKERRTLKVKHLVEVGVDVNFPVLVGAVKINGNNPFFVEIPFPQKRVMKLQERENKARSENNLALQSKLKSLASRISKGAYFRFIEKVHREAKKRLGLKTFKSIKFIWRIENPKVLRNMHSQFAHQGWKPTLLDNCLREKQSHIYLEIEKRNPAYTSVMCNKCGRINKRGGDKLDCECGEVIDWHRNASLNLLNRRSYATGGLVTASESDDADFLPLHHKTPLPLPSR